MRLHWIEMNVKEAVPQINRAHLFDVKHFQGVTGIGLADNIGQALLDAGVAPG